MSYDRKIDQLCPHGIVAEPGTVDDDRRTIHPAWFIANYQSVKVRLNGLLDVPSMGLVTPGKTVGSGSGPFTITQGVNDTLQVQLGAAIPQVWQVPPGTRLAATEVVGALNRVARGVFFSTTGRRVAMQTSDLGVGARAFIYPTPLATTLGLVANREYRGKQAAPGWQLLGAKNTLSDQPYRIIVFDTPLKSYQDTVEICYATVRQQCRRCGGTGVENDWRYTTSGNYIEVVDEALLIQELLKLFYTVRGSNIFHLWYGTDLMETIGKKLSARGLVQNFIISDITQAFTRWQSIKKQQEGAVGQVVSDKEFPYRLGSVDLRPDDSDPTVVYVSIIIYNRSGDPVMIERGVRVPQPSDLLGSTAQQGLFRASTQQYVLVG
jgi:hypothetical protein